MGKYIPRDERFCLLCAQDVENEQHFLLGCQLYHDARVKLFHSLNETISSDFHSSNLQSASSPSFHMHHVSTADKLTVMLGASIKGMKFSKQVHR